MLQAKETQEIVIGEKVRMLVIGLLHGTRRRIELLSCYCPMYFTVY
jgi:hypothetical protein